MSSKASPWQAQPVGRTPDSVPVSAESITIAITLYDRRDYIIRAIESALAQPRQVKVLVVEDCSPDPGIRTFIEERFADRIHYHRNAMRRGLFGNWNVCLDLVQHRGFPSFTTMIILILISPMRWSTWRGTFPIAASTLVRSFISTIPVDHFPFLLPACPDPSGASILVYWRR